LLTDLLVVAIENILEKAIYEAGGISKHNFGDINKIKWSRGSRTDKGVHALKNVVSYKMMLNLEKVEADPLGFHIAEDINKHLPEDIRAIACVKVSRLY
jgi:tRNA pseudouridine38-40 synthase